MDICKRFGLVRSYELAKEIRDELIALYGDEETEYWSQVEKQWKKFMKRFWRLKKEVAILILNEVVEVASYCKACQMTKGICNECEFAKKHGKCQDGNSLFARFKGVFRIETGIRAGEPTELEDWTSEVARCIEEDKCCRNIL